MAKVNYLGVFTWCVPEYENISEAYPGYPPGSFIDPLEMPLKYAMAMYWRCKAYSIFSSISLASSTHSSSASCSYNTIFQSEIDTEANLVCSSDIKTTGGFSSPDEIASFTFFKISINSFFMVRGNKNLFWKYGTFENTSGTSGSLEGESPQSFDILSAVAPSSGLTKLTDGTLTILDRSFSLNIFANFSSGVSGSGAHTILGNDYWPYANEYGSDPVYNTTTGLPL